LALENLQSIFNENLQSKIDSFSSNQPIHSNDSRISVDSGAHVKSPILNTILIPQSSFVNESNLTSNYDTKKYDPRISRPGALIFNKNTEKGTIFDPSLTNEQDFNLTNNNLINSKGWESLYTSEHQSLPLPSQIDINNPFQAYNYGGNVNRGNLDIRYSTQPNSGFSLPSFNVSRGNEPYIISPIGNEGRQINRGSREFPLFRSIIDTDRVSKYLFSQAGIQNILRKNTPFTIPTVVTINKKEADEIRKNNRIKGDESLKRIPLRYNTFTNPVNLLSNVLRESGMHIGRTPIQSGGVLGIFKQYSAQDSLGKLREDSTSANSPIFNSINGFDNPEDKGLLSAIAGAIGTGGFGGPPKKSLSNLGDSMTTSTLQNYDERFVAMGDDSSDNPESSKTGMPFYFVDLRDNKVVTFRAYLEGINENISPNWSSTNYIGRSEPVYTYENSSRDLSFTLKVFAQTYFELKKIWAKLNRLTSMCYPQYQEDTLFDTKANQRMKPPLVKLRLGDLFGGARKNELTGFLRSLTYTIPDESTWEMNANEKVPKHVLVTVSYQVIHGNVPQLFNDDGTAYKFYGYDKKWDEELNEDGGLNV